MVIEYGKSGAAVSFIALIHDWAREDTDGGKGAS
jgi:hypothetical protein